MVHKRTFVFLLLLILLTGCHSKKTDPTPEKTPAPGELFFTTIEQKEMPGGTSEGYQLSYPALVNVSKQDEIKPLASLISSNALHAVQEINFNDYFCVVVFQGTKPTTGFSITIESITENESTITVKAISLVPGSDRKKDDIVTSPYHLVKIKREAGLKGLFEFNLIVNDQKVMTVEKNLP